jgi:hypothetical protein
MPGDELDEEESLWARRLEESYQRAVRDEDQRGMQMAAKAGLSHIRQRKAERTKAAAAKVEQAEDDGQFSIGSLDQMVSILTQAEPDPIDRTKIAEVLRRSRELSRPDFVTLFLKAYENPAFASDLATYAATWEEPQPAQKGEPDESIPQATARAN